MTSKDTSANIPPQIFLSFIVPVYNTEPYLDECLHSLLEQDIPLDRYEIICVNDGSTDGSLEILRRFEAEYPNIIVIDKENGGVTTARNAGLFRANGEFIWYIDADDLIFANCLSELQTLAHQAEFDRLIVSNYLCEGVASNLCSLNSSWHDSVVWRNLFRRDFLLKNNLFFHYPELVFGEDALYMYECKRHFPKTLCVEKPYYLHRSRSDSASTANSITWDIRRLDSNFREAQIMKEYYERHDGILPEETANRFMSFLYGTMYRIAQMPRQEASIYLSKLRVSGLYPYRRPKECTITRSYETARTDWMGKLFDYIYLHICTPSGFFTMRLWLFLGKAKQKLRK